MNSMVVPSAFQTVKKLGVQTEMQGNEMIRRKIRKSFRSLFF